MADVVIIADIFPAREHDTGLVHSRDLVVELVKRYNPVQRGSRSLQVYHGGNVKETTQVLASILHSGDLAVIMGAGDIYVVTDQLLRLAEETKEEEK